jgi:DNA modification methylase
VILTGDCVQSMRTWLLDEEVQTCVTSPPYFGLRDYGVEGQLGLEGTPEDYVRNMVGVFREVRRVLRNDGTLWLNLGDSYSGSGKGGNPGDSPHTKQNRNAGSLTVRGVRRDGLKPKDLIGIPWRVAFALQTDGWYLRQDIIWHKPNPMPHPNTDRCVSSHEYIFLLSKRPTYYFDFLAIKEPSTGRDAGNGFKRVERVSLGGRGDAKRFVAAAGGLRNKRSVWTVTTKPFKGAHFATFPQDLIEPCILAGSKPGDLVLDPFGGAGTTGLVAAAHGRRYVLCELNPEYVVMAEKRIAAAC